MKRFDPHPGSIELVDRSTEKTERVPAESVPMGQRFVYLDDRGTATNDPEKAAERLPILSIVTTPMDAQNRIVPIGQATKVLLQFIGPEKKTLRSSTMSKGA